MPIARRIDRPLLIIVLRTGHDGFTDDHSSHWFAVLFLFGCINTVRLRIHGKAMYRVLGSKVL
jgi:hypothetical protein